MTKTLLFGILVIGYSLEWGWYLALIPVDKALEVTRQSWGATGPTGMLEKILKRQPWLYPLTPGVRRTPSTTPFHQRWLPNPYAYQCNPHSKIFGSIPVGTTKCIPITEG